MIVHLLVTLVALVALFLRAKNEEMRADYRLRSQTKSEIQDLETALEIAQAKNEKLRADLEDAHNKLGLRIATIEAAWGAAQSSRRGL